ncbi:MAG: hypothetical protein NTZ74_11260 [Chloroflexi bacterium]|nr:hypothetical protein [Chloroflexota bacterium]
MYERHSDPLLPRKRFVLRVFKHALVGMGILIVSLGVGVLGYHAFENLSWVDAILNASMILGGMGPVAPIVSEGGKLFASAYALFSGMIFLVVAGMMIAPVAHRILHSMHLDEGE